MLMFLNRLEMDRVHIYQNIAEINWSCNTSQSREYEMPSACQIR